MLVTGDDRRVADRFTRSALTTDGRLLPTARFESWLAERAGMNRFAVHRVPFQDLDGWRFAEDTGNLVHSSGRFFSVEGLEVATDFGRVPRWTQPIINQPEIGIVGILVKEFDGILHCLMQAKMEPGNVNTLQLSPTVQATRSNYTRVHKGSAIPYLEHFVAPRTGQVLVDALQSEQGAWFLHKRNRNMVVQTDEDIEVRDDFCWLTIGQIHELLRVDNLVNMDSRTVLSCMPFGRPDGPARTVAGDDPFRAALVESVGGQRGALHTDAEVLSWFVEAKSRYAHQRRRIPLRELEGWRAGPDAISHEDGKYFQIVGVQVEASSREVSSWTQPLVAPVGHGISAFLTRRIDGVLHVLAQARAEAGTLDVVELAPTVHCLPGNYRDVPREHRPAFLDQVLSADRSRIRYEVVQSEEGGRFYHAQNRYQIIEADDLPLAVPPDYRWVTVAQLMGLLRLSNYLNVEARSLVACLQTLW
ncbi:NDP-hexose 2,3-dehydratase [Plantactinospora sp. KBS50]|nr:NDP-hexose 2,3-dehydratase [Plantactinospora sp. KBS50]